MENIGIFKGKQRTYNIQVLNVLFDNGPLSAWSVTKLFKSPMEKHCLLAILNRRLRSLEKKDYVRKNGKLWILPLKGVVATILTQSEPKQWNPKWDEIFQNNIKLVREIYDKSKVRIVTSEGTFSMPEFLNSSGGFTSLKEFVTLSMVVKKLIELGMINLDLIKEKQLFNMILLETANFEQLYPDKV